MNGYYIRVVKRVSTMNDGRSLSIKEFIEIYQKDENRVRGGSLCFWGQWFGKPMDHFHGIFSVSFDHNVLTIDFATQAFLNVTNPGSILTYSNRLEIATADHVYFEWPDRDKSGHVNHRYHYEFSRNGQTISGKSNIHWSVIDQKSLSIKKPAVLII